MAFGPLFCLVGSSGYCTLSHCFCALICSVGYPVLVGLQLVDIALFCDMQGKYRIYLIQLMCSNIFVLGDRCVHVLTERNKDWWKK